MRENIWLWNLIDFNQWPGVCTRAEQAHKSFCSYQLFNGSRPVAWSRRVVWMSGGAPGRNIHLHVVSIASAINSRVSYTHFVVYNKKAAAQCTIHMMVIYSNVECVLRTTFLLRKYLTRQLGDWQVKVVVVLLLMLPQQRSPRKTRTDFRWHFKWFRSDEQNEWRGDLSIDFWQVQIYHVKVQ